MSLNNTKDFDKFIQARIKRNPVINPSQAPLLERLRQVAKEKRVKWQ